jgi:azurin
MPARLLLSLFIVLASCASVSGQSRKSTAPPSKPPGRDPVRVVQIASDDNMKFSVTKISAKPGEQLRIVLTSKGTMPKIVMAHNLVVLKPGTDVAKFITAGSSFRASDFIAPEMMGSVLAKTGFAGPGETVDVLFKVPAKPGRHPFVCTFSGHFASGMVGAIVVK